MHDLAPVRWSRDNSRGRPRLTLVVRSGDVEGRVIGIGRQEERIVPVGDVDPCSAVRIGDDRRVVRRVSTGYQRGVAPGAAAIRGALDVERGAERRERGQVIVVERHGREVRDAVGADRDPWVVGALGGRPARARARIEGGRRRELPAVAAVFRRGRADRCAGEVNPGAHEPLGVAWIGGEDRLDLAIDGDLAERRGRHIAGDARERADARDLAWVRDAQPCRVVCPCSASGERERSCAGEAEQSGGRRHERTSISRRCGFDPRPSAGAPSLLSTRSASKSRPPLRVGKHLER